MAERGYFDLRNLVPGYTFLMLIIALNIIPIAAKVQFSHIISIFGAFIALVGGPALGFLISQSWWWYFHWRLTMYDWSPIQELITRFKLTTKKSRSDKRKVLIVYDYVLHNFIHSDSKRKGLSAYLFRRWDMFILLSTTMWSLVLGAIAGIFLRILSEIFIFQASLCQKFEENRLFFLSNAEFWISLILLTLVILWISFIRHGLCWVLYEYNCMHEVAIRGLEAHVEKELRKVFTQDFFENMTGKNAF